MQNNYNSYEEFITSLKALADPKAQVKGLMQYFVDNVKGDFDAFKCQTDDDFINRLDTKYDYKNPEHRAAAIADLRNRYNISDDYLAYINDNYGKRNLAYAVNMAIIPQTLSENGLLTKGVCSNFASFVQVACMQLGIPCAFVEGTIDNTKHAWNKIDLGDGKGLLNYDFTKVILIRDKAGKWYEKTTYGDWMGVTDEALVRLQPTLRIQKIDGVEIPEINAGTIASQKNFIDL